jgi:hypothetical protein
MNIFQKQIVKNNTYFLQFFVQKIHFVNFLMGALYKL